MTNSIRVVVGEGTLSPAVTRHLKAPVNAVPPVQFGNGSLAAVQRHIDRTTTPASAGTKAKVQMGEGSLTGAVLRHLARRAPIQVGESALPPAIMRHLNMAT